MKKEQFTCSAGNDPRHKYDFAEPWDESEWDTKDQAAYRVTGDLGVALVRGHAPPDGCLGAIL